MLSSRGFDGYSVGGKRTAIIFADYGSRGGRLVKKRTNNDYTVRVHNTGAYGDRGYTKRANTSEKYRSSDGIDDAFKRAVEKSKTRMMNARANENNAQCSR